MVATAWNLEKTIQRRSKLHEFERSVQFEVLNTHLNYTRNHRPLIIFCMKNYADVNSDSLVACMKTYEINNLISHLKFTVVRSQN